MNTSGDLPEHLGADRQKVHPVQYLVMQALCDTLLTPEIDLLIPHLMNHRTPSALQIGLPRVQTLTGVCAPTEITKIVRSYRTSLATETSLDVQHARDSGHATLRGILEM